MNKLVLFDFDGTLADTAPDLAAAANRLRQRRNLADLPYEQLRPYASHGARGLIKAALGITTDAPEYDSIKQQFLADYANDMLNKTQLFDGINELLETLENNNLAWGIVTNKTEALAIPIIKYLGLEKRSQVNVGGDTTAFSKPHPEPLLFAARQLNVNPIDCIYIGDDERDIIAGKAAGMATAVAAYGYCHLDDPKTWAADYMAYQPQEINNAIELWINR